MRNIQNRNATELLHCIAVFYTLNVCIKFSNFLTRRHLLASFRSATPISGPAKHNQYKRYVKYFTDNIQDAINNKT